MLSHKLENFGLKDMVQQIEKEIEDEIQDAVRFAEESNMPDPATAEDFVYV